MLELMRADWAPAGHRTWMQTAAGSRWEDARGLHTPASSSEVRALVRGWGAGEVAVEYEWLGHPLVFVGARPPVEESAVRIAAESPSDPVVALAGLAGGAPSGLASVEIGAVNACQSVGPLRLWSSGDPPELGDVAALLDGRPDLRSCSVPVAVELAWREPRECWIGREVSRPVGDRHVVSPGVVAALVGGWGFVVSRRF